MSPPPPHPPPGGTDRPGGTRFATSGWEHTWLQYSTTVQFSTVQYSTVQYSNTPGGRRELHHAVTLAEGNVEEGRESLKETRIIFYF